jgi:hypothetical protein
VYHISIQEGYARWAVEAEGQGEVARLRSRIVCPGFGYSRFVCFGIVPHYSQRRECW